MRIALIIALAAAAARAEAATQSTGAPDAAVKAVEIPTTIQRVDLTAGQAALRAAIPVPPATVEKTMPDLQQPESAAPAANPAAQVQSIATQVHDALDQSGPIGQMGSSEAAGLGAGTFSALTGEKTIPPTGAVTVPAGGETKVVLTQGLKLRQSIRRFLFDNGKRESREEIGEAYGRFSASLNGGGSGSFLGWSQHVSGYASGSSEAHLYNSLLTRGEKFTITVLDENSRKMLEDLERAGKETLSPHASIFKREVSDAHRDTKKIDELRPILARFHDVMDELEFMPRDAEQERVYQELRLWATGSQIKINTIITPNRRVAKDGDQLEHWDWNSWSTEHYNGVSGRSPYKIKESELRIY